MKPEIRYIRRLCLVFIVLLSLSGITAFPLRTELGWLMAHRSAFHPSLQSWIEHISSALGHTPDLVLYGTDWLAFAHLVIAFFFIGVYIDPVRNKFIVLTGMVACAAVFPLSFIMGPVRGIPFFHQLIDCSFGLFGFIPLFFIYKTINRIEHDIPHA